MPANKMVLRLSAFFLVGSLCQAIEPDDLLGKSEFCKSISEEVTPRACQKTSALVPPATSPLEEIVRFQSKVSEVESASRAVKKNLFENAKISFVENLALAEWMSSEPVYVDKSLFGRAIQQTKQSCAGPLSESLDKILTNPEQRSLDFRMSPATTKNLKKVLKKKYLLAFIESSRLRRLLQDNYLREPTKTMAQKRLEKIQVSFPMTAQVHPPLLGSELEAAFGIPTNEMNSVAEGLWFDEYLFPDKPTLSLRTTAVPSSSKNRKDCDRLVCTSTGLIAQKIHDLDDLPLRAEKALIEAMRGHLIKSVESFAFLCQTDPCTAFSVNRDVTANTLQGIFDPLKQRRLQKEICACKILDPLEILSPNQTLGLLGAGVGLGLTCFGSLASGVLAGAATVACPSTAVVFAGLSAIQSAQHTQNFFRGDRHQRISDYLPALTPEQRLDGRKLGRDALESLPADIAISAGTLGAVKVGAPYVVEAGKKGLQFIQKGSKRAEESAATASSDLGKVERERRSPQKKFAGTEHRTSSLPSISKIPADNLKPVDLKPWPTLPDNLRILQGTRKNGETVHYYESAEKLKDGSVQISWGEIYFDKSTGALDCNYTSCRTFFQNMLKARSGKTHVGFLDVASVGKVNSEFQAGRKAGDALILDVYSKIMKAGEGKVSVARWGGDEFVFEIAEPDPFKAQAILKKIQNLVKDDLDGPGMQIFKDERKARQAAYQASPTAESKARLEDLDKIYGPNVSIGSAQFGVDDSLENVLQLAESQATVGKRSDKLRHGLSAEKYLDSRPPMDKPDLDYRPYVRPPIASPSWRNTQPKPQEKPDWNRGSHLEIAPVRKPKNASETRF
ncbi:MAG: diguanylate cyclase [Bdellovibrionales bacterium]|nr:diguanylate cyclase [Bdellovibrionales bacterium]